MFFFSFLRGLRAADLGAAISSPES